MYHIEMINKWTKIEWLVLKILKQNKPEHLQNLTYTSQLKLNPNNKYSRLYVVKCKV